ncbi:MAG TPA: FtsX-like permease family protein [Cyclobacteriaceae bacterium]|nr:FtsX-like permease family protein [Cyclobacteriaceae bacterium]
MLRNYFLIAARTILRQKFYSMINVFGLTLGIVISFLIALYILDELSYDRFHENIGRMYRLDLHGKLGGQEVFTTNTAPVIAGALVNEIPEVEQSMRIENWDDVIIKYQDKSFMENKVYIVDSNFFNFFSFTLIHGDRDRALTEPNSIVLTESSAKKIFADEDPVGKMINLGNGPGNFKVTGIVKNPPANSHIRFNYLVSMSSYKWMADNPEWLNNYLTTYFIIYPEADIKNVAKKLDELVVTHVGPEIFRFMGISLEQFLGQDGAYGYMTTPVEDIHLKVRMEDELEPGGDIAYIYIFLAIGLFIIIIASINFMNLSTARSAGRSREVGLRKTFGSHKSQLVGQFMTEAVIYSLIAMVLSVIMVILVLPLFNGIAGKSMTLSILFTPEMSGLLVAITLLIGVLSGLYPAFYLTRFRIAEVMKGILSAGMRGKGLRGTLVVLQFSISIALIICTILVYNQLLYTQNKNLGINKENVLVIPNVNLLDKQKGAVKESLMEQNSIVAASYCSVVFPGYSQMTIFRKPGLDQDFIICRNWADYEQVEALGLQLAAGRNFSRDFPSDSTAILVNEVVVRQFEWEDPIGQEIISFDGNNGEQTRLRVVGVLKDFNYESLRQEVRPLMIALRKEESMMAVRFNSPQPGEAIALVESIWKKFLPAEPFNYSFLDQNFDSMYRAEQRLGKLFSIFTFFAIFIASLGLFGLAAYTAEQRTREIGIRKALGATVSDIVGLLSKEFTRLVIIAFFIAIFPAWYVMHKWLEGFAYKIDISIMVFIMSGLLAFGIALLTISYQSIKAARINPATSLRYE